MIEGESFIAESVRGRRECNIIRGIDRRVMVRVRGKQ
jgi:hypothetical protein